MKLRLIAQAAAVAAGIVAALPAVAAPLTLAPLQPALVAVGDRDAVVYYVVRSDGYEVVVTFAANSPDDGSSMRSTVLLQPGQREELSLGGPAATAPARLEIVRDGETLVINPAAVDQQRVARR
jgi:hypothetical protein